MSRLWQRIAPEGLDGMFFVGKTHHNFTDCTKDTKNLFWETANDSLTHFVLCSLQCVAKSLETSKGQPI